jgi:hypothetical protein
MSRYCYSSIRALGAILLGMLAIGSAQAGSNWFALDPDKTLCDVDSLSCTIELAWSVGNADKFDEWKICWMPRVSRTWLDDDCKYYSKVRTIDNNFYAIPDLNMNHDYRVKLEGRREKNGNWTCVEKTMIRYVGYGAYLASGGICTDF